MGFKRGDVHLVNFNPSKGTEAGKIRPALIVQCNDLNDVNHPSTVVLPLTTQVHSNAQPLRFNLAAREALNQTSDVMICLLYTSPSPRDRTRSRMPSSA